MVTAKLYLPQGNPQIRIMTFSQALGPTGTAGAMAAGMGGILVMEVYGVWSRWDWGNRGFYGTL